MNRLLRTAFEPQRRVSGVLVAVTSVTVIAAAPARAQPTTFSARAAFDAATTGQTTDGFTGLVAPTGVTVVSQVGPGTLSGSRAMFVVGDQFQPAGYPNAFAYGTGPVLTPQGGRGPVIFTLTWPSLITAFGVDFSSYNYGNNGGAGTIFTFALSNGASFARTQSGERPSLDFFGVTDPMGFTSVTVSGGAWAPVFDNVTIGAVQPMTSAPEASSLTMLGTGIGLVGGWRLRRRALRPI